MITFSPALNLLPKSHKKTSVVRFILSQDEKYDNDKALVKEIFNYNQNIGESQIRAKEEQVRKLYNLAYGIISEEDYGQIEEDYAHAVGGTPQLQVSGLDFYEIVPPLLRAIIGSYEKSYVEYTAEAVNPEATNHLLEKFNSDLKTVLISNIEAIFNAENQVDPNDPNSVQLVDQKRKLMMESEEVQKYYTTTFRAGVEQWAAHRINIEDQAFRIKEIEKRLLEQIIVTDDPTIHIDYIDGNYVPEIWPENLTFSIRSNDSEDYSDGSLVGRVEFMSFSEALNKYASYLSDTDVEKLSSWSNDYNAATFRVTGHTPTFTPAQNFADTRHNFEVMESLDDVVSKYSRSAFDNGSQIKIVTQYFYIPRKIGVLTYRGKNGDFTKMVDETFKVTLKPKYNGKRNKDNLVSGEHVDWSYIPELWRGKKMTTKGGQGVLTGTELTKSELSNGADDNEIWIYLEKHPIQYSNPYYRYSLQIPVHGGSKKNQYGDFTSVVKSTGPYQVMYNWLHNRSKQLINTEIGKFFLINEALIPAESMEGEWGKHALEQFAVTARDTGLAPISNITNQGGSNALATQGYGQTVDLTKTAEVLEKTNLAAIIKRQCYEAVGLTPEFITGDMSPHQSAKSAGMGQQRTLTQIQHLYSRLNEVMQRARTTMLETAKFIAQTSPTVEMVYTTTEAGRQIFKVGTEDFTLYQIAVYAKSNAADLTTIEMIKQYVGSNNTMGADALEMTTLLSFKSLPEIFKKLKDIQINRNKQKEQEYQQQVALQQQQMQAAQQRQQELIAAQEREKALDRENNIMVSQIKAMGYANDDADSIQKSILELRTVNAEQKALYDRARVDNQIKLAEENRRDMAVDISNRQQNLNEQIKLKAVQQKDKELELREMEIRARNKRTEAID